MTIKQCNYVCGYTPFLIIAYSQKLPAFQVDRGKYDIFLCQPENFRCWERSFRCSRLAV